MAKFLGCWGMLAIITVVAALRLGPEHVATLLLAGISVGSLVVAIITAQEIK